MKVEKLMRQLFKNKDEQKLIKVERSDYMLSRKCDYENCIYDGTNEEDFCEVCKKRHEFYLRLRELKYKNIAILNKVRRILLTR